MESISKRYVWIFFIILLAIMIAAYLMNIFLTSPAPKPIVSQEDMDELSDGYYTIRDQNGLTILQTGLTVRIDDQFIDENNINYVIIKVEGKNAVAEKVSQQHSQTLNNHPRRSWAEITLPSWSSISAAARGRRHVVIYSTHTDESYIPTSGRASKPGKGDILKVAGTLSNTLRENGISVSHSRALHDPHDINAYHRSRRTITQLLKEQPDAAFDIHRDSAPPDQYLTVVNGLDTARVMIVVGRSNPNMQSNLDYAKRIKAEADRIHPGLMRGIYLGKGSYNQDLYPTALLFEVGTENIPLDLAETAVRNLGDALTSIFSKS
ncbi:MAG TPA: stage II sporulation protein P [Syntrophomonadaceae bacterium]|nr:stage II sporulation protein P [Syntrophomonadaceae bacterium]